MAASSCRKRAALCCLLLVALAVGVAAEDRVAQQQYWRQSLVVLRSVDAFLEPTRRLEGLVEDVAQQHSHVATPANAATEKAAAEDSEKHPVVLTVVGALLAVGFMVGVVMMLRRSHGQSEEKRGIRLESRLVDNDEEAGLGLMASDEHAEDEYAEEDDDDDEWEEKEGAAAVGIQDKSD